MILETWEIGDADGEIEATLQKKRVRGIIKYNDASHTFYFTSYCTFLTDWHSLFSCRAHASCGRAQVMLGRGQAQDAKQQQHQQQQQQQA